MAWADLLVRWVFECWCSHGGGEDSKWPQCRTRCLSCLIGMAFEVGTGVRPAD